MAPRHAETLFRGDRIRSIGRRDVVYTTEGEKEKKELQNRDGCATIAGGPVGKRPMRRSADGRAG